MKCQKDPRAPKGPKTPWVFFCMHYRQSFKAKLGPYARGCDIYKLTSQRWKALTDHNRLRWETLSRADKERYQVEKSSYTRPFLLPPGEKVTRRQVKSKCSVDGCTSQARKGGVCRRHGAKGMECSVDRCTNMSVCGGVCIRHGARVGKDCSVDGCTNTSFIGGVCKHHCVVPDEVMMSWTYQSYVHQYKDGQVMQCHGEKIVKGNFEDDHLLKKTIWFCEFPGIHLVSMNNTVFASEIIDEGNVAAV